MQQALALDVNSTQTTSTIGSAAALTGASGAQRTLSLLVNFRDNPVQPYTLTQAYDTLFSTTDGHFREGSAGAAWLVGDLLGWFTIDMDSTACDTTTLATLAQAGCA